MFYNPFRISFLLFWRFVLHCSRFSEIFRGYRKRPVASDYFNRKTWKGLRRKKFNKLLDNFFWIFADADCISTSSPTCRSKIRFQYIKLYFISFFFLLEEWKKRFLVHKLQRASVSCIFMPFDRYRRQNSGLFNKELCSSKATYTAQIGPVFILRKQTKLFSSFFNNLASSSAVLAI